MNLKKGLGFFDVFSISSGAMISSGIFILPGIAFALAGPAVFISYLLAGSIACIGILNIVELSTAMPKAGGNYFFITRAMGPLIGTITGILSWFALSLKSAFAVYGLSHLIYLFTGFPPLVSGMIILAVFILLNIVGVDFASKFEVVLVVGLLAIMIWYVSFGSTVIDINRLVPFAPFGGRAIVTTAAFVFVSFGGLINVSTISEEVRNPKKNIPAGMISSVIVITLLYGAVMFVTVAVIDPALLSGSLTPLADGAMLFSGFPGYVAVMIGAVLAFITTANAGVMSASRYPMALARDHILPSFFGKVTRKSRSPVWAILATGLIIGGSLFMDLETLVKSASTVILMNYLLSSFAVIILRISGIQNYRPSFKVAFYPFFQIITIVLVIFLLQNLGIEAAEVTLVLLGISILIYLLYGRKTVGKEFALMHLIEKVVNRKITGENLEEELMGIVHSRDDIVFDQIDEVFQNALFMDLEGENSSSISLDYLFEKAAEEFTSSVPIEKKWFISMLHEREKIASTALSSFLAVPHIVCEDPGFFRMMVIRVKEGVRFSDNRPFVRAIFILFGSMDRRDLHLRTLSAIAQISMEKEFASRWLETKDPSGLKALLLLGSRIREGIS